MILFSCMYVSHPTEQTRILIFYYGIFLRFFDLIFSIICQNNLFYYLLNPENPQTYRFLLSM